jgi:2-amino-4-hydroxy-6-hydroxymethyldihydropteridine diphosphokinase
VGTQGRNAIYIGLGANLPHPQYGAPRQTLQAALAELDRRGIRPRRLSPWYRTAPVPISDQPWYLNAVAEVSTDLAPDALLAEMHRVEADFGRVRSVRNAARFIDLDLLDFRGDVAEGGTGRATLPHPRLAERAFVLRPLADLVPDWRHPVSGLPIVALVAGLSADQVTQKVRGQGLPLPFEGGSV